MRDILTAALVTSCLTGCFSIEAARTPGGERHVLVSNYGWYLFNWLPLACGNADPNGSTPWVLFRDDVTMDKVQQRFSDYRTACGVSIVNLNYHNQEDVLLNLPGTDIPLPLPYVITYREVQLSGVVK